MSVFNELGYTLNTVFKVIDSTEGLNIGDLVTVVDDNGSTCPLFEGKGKDYSAYMYLPTKSEMDYEELELVTLNGFEDGLLDSDGDLLFGTYVEYLESNKDDVKETEVQEVESAKQCTNYEVEEVVKVVDVGTTRFTLGQEVRIVELYADYVKAENLDSSDYWCLGFDKIEKLHVENTEETKQDVKLTPFEKKGWTKRSILKIVNCTDSFLFKDGDLVVLDVDDGDKQPLFKKLELYGKESDEFQTGRYIWLSDLEYLGEVGDNLSEVIPEGVALLESVEVSKTLRTHEDFRKLTPDTLIDVSISGVEFQVPLKEILLTTKIIGLFGGLNKTTNLYENLIKLIPEHHKLTDKLKASDEFLRILGWEDFEKDYFVVPKAKEIKDKISEKLKQQASLNDEIQALQSELENI